MGLVVGLNFINNNNNNNNNKLFGYLHLSCLFVYSIHNLMFDEGHLGSNEKFTKANRNL